MWILKLETVSSLERCDFDEITCVVLTGMGADGTKGISGLAARHKKIHVIAQDEETCVVYGMPKAAYDIGAVMYQEKLQSIAPKTYKLINQG